MNDIERFDRNCRLLQDRIKGTDLGWTGSGHINLNLLFIQEAARAKEDGLTMLSDLRQRIIACIKEARPKTKEVICHRPEGITWDKYVDEFIYAMTCPDGDLLPFVNDTDIFRTIMGVRFSHPEEMKNEQQWCFDKSCDGVLTR